jgi:prepilin peptidase CpaA
MASLDVVFTYVALAVLLVCAAVTDLRCGKIYNVVTYPAVALGLIGHTLLGGVTGGPGPCELGLAGAAAGLAAGFLPMLAAWLAGGVGMGDAKLMAAVGALGGWKFALDTLFFGLMAALALAIVVMIRRRVVRRTLGRVWRFLVLALAPRSAPLPTTEDSPKVPLGLAFSIGAAAALAKALTGASGWIPGY